MGGNGVAHRAGIVVVDELAVGLVDLDCGEVSAVEPDIAAILARPELLAVGDPDEIPLMAAYERATTEPLPSGAILELNGPIALRVDGGRLLAWDHRQNLHVELEQIHLDVLAAAKTSVCVGDLAVDPYGVELAAAELLDLGLVNAEIPEPPEVVESRDQEPQTADGSEELGTATAEHEVDPEAEEPPTDAEAELTGEPEPEPEPEHEHEHEHKHEPAQPVGPSGVRNVARRGYRFARRVARKLKLAGRKVKGRLSGGGRS